MSSQDADLSLSRQATEMMSLAEDDLVLLDELLGVVIDLGTPDPYDARLIGIGVLSELLLSGEIIAGDVERGRFVPWNLSPDAALARIAREWLAADSPVQMDRVVAWFSTPDRLPKVT